MKNKILIFSISFFVNFSYAQTNVNQQIGNFESYYLKNGLKVILLPFDNEQKLGVSVNIKGGSKNELAHEKGYSHILEHLLFKKTENFTNIKEFISTKSNNWNGATNKDFTYYFETFQNTGSNLDDFLKMESERLFKIKITDVDLESEKQIILNELQVNNSSAKNQLFESTSKQLFQLHPYTHPTIGYSNTIKNATLKDIQNFYLRTYQPQNIFIVIYGNFKKDLAKEYINKHFSSVVNSKQESLNIMEEPFLKLPTENTILSKEKINLSNVSWNSPNFLFDKRFISARILWLSSTLEPFGHIHKKYILNESKINIKDITSIQPDFFNFLDYQPFILTISQKDNPQYKETIKKITEDMEETENFSEQSFNKMKQIVNNEWVNTENSLEALVNNFITFERWGDWRLYFYFKKQSQSASFKDAVSFLNEYIQPKSRHITIIKNGEEYIDSPYNVNLDNYFNKTKESLDKINLNHYEFKQSSSSKRVNTIEDLLKYKIEKEYIQNNNKIKLNYIKEPTNGDFIYIKINNKSKNIELDTQYKNSCMLTKNFLDYENIELSTQEIKEKIIELNLKFNNNFFSFYVKVPKQNFNKTFDLLFSLLNKPSFNEVKFEQSKNALIDSINSTKDNPNVAIQEYINKSFNLYPTNHLLYPYSTTEILEDVSKINIEDVKKCYQAYKGYPDSTITIIGDLSDDEIEKQINKIIQIKSNYQYSSLKDEKIKTAEDVFKEHNNTHQKIGPFNKSSSFFYGQTTINLDQNSPDYYKILFAINVFGDGPNSILFNEFREKDGSSYNIKSNLITKNNTNYAKIVTTGSLPLEDSEIKINKIENIWNTFTKSGITENQLNIFKEQFNNQVKSYVSDENQILNLETNLFNREVNIDWMISLKNKVNQLTTEEVNDAIHKHLQNKRIFMVYSY